MTARTANERIEGLEFLQDRIYVSWPKEYASPTVAPYSFVSDDPDDYDDEELSWTEASLIEAPIDGLILSVEQDLEGGNYHGMTSVPGELLAIVQKIANHPQVEREAIPRVFACWLHANSGIFMR